MVGTCLPTAYVPLREPDPFCGARSLHRISVQTVPTCLRPIASAAPAERSMSRPRVNGPRSLIVTTTEPPVRGLVTTTLVPNGNVLWAAVPPSARNSRPPAVCRPGVYRVAFIEFPGQALDSEPASATDPKEIARSNPDTMILND